jgi:hypothetical protein
MEEGLVVACPWCCPPPPPATSRPAAPRAGHHSFVQLPPQHAPAGELPLPLLLHLHVFLQNPFPFCHMERVTSAQIMPKSVVPSSHGVLGIRVWPQFANIVSTTSWWARCRAFSFVQYNDRILYKNVKALFHTVVCWD